MRRAQAAPVAAAAVASLCRNALSLIAPFQVMRSLSPCAGGMGSPPPELAAFRELLLPHSAELRWLEAARSGIRHHHICVNKLITPLFVSACRIYAHVHTIHTPTVEFERLLGRFPHPTPPRWPLLTQRARRTDSCLYPTSTRAFPRPTDRSLIPQEASLVSSTGVSSAIGGDDKPCIRESVPTSTSASARVIFFWRYYLVPPRMSYKDRLVWISIPKRSLYLRTDWQVHVAPAGCCTRMSMWAIRYIHTACICTCRTW